MLIFFGDHILQELTTLFLTDSVPTKLHFHPKQKPCAANFSFAQLAKRKSLGRSKPATNSQAQALQHTVWNVSTISKPY